MTLQKKILQLLWAKYSVEPGLVGTSFFEKLSHVWSSLLDLGHLPSVWDTRQSPDYTRQRALGSGFVGKDVFAE
jgi:hypothetical protein